MAQGIRSLTRFGVWIACIAVTTLMIVTPPFSVAFGVTLAFVDVFLRTLGYDIYLISVLITFAAFVLALRIVMELALRGLILR